MLPSTDSKFSSLLSIAGPSLVSARFFAEVVKIQLLFPVKFASVFQFLWLLNLKPLVKVFIYTLVVYYPTKVMFSVASRDEILNCDLSNEIVEWYFLFGLLNRNNIDRHKNNTSFFNFTNMFWRYIRHHHCTVFLKSLLNLERAK